MAALPIEQVDADLPGSLAGAPREPKQAAPARLPARAQLMTSHPEALQGVTAMRRGR